MGLSWDGYIAVYYVCHVALYPIIYVILLIILPSQLLDWILNTIFSFEVLHKTNDDNREYIKTTIDIDSKFEERKDDSPHWCICKVVSKRFGECFSKLWPGCCQNLFCKKLWSKKYLHLCYTCVNNCHNDVENIILPGEQVTQMETNDEPPCCGLTSSYIKNGASVYMILCTTLWCASVYFFEQAILSYAPVIKGHNCPIPEMGTVSTVMDCFIYKNYFDQLPINKTFPTRCNGTTSVSFDGEWSWAACFVWINGELGVIDVIDELGVCSGITAFIGFVVVLISYLCRKHRWRFIFDILACVSFASIFIQINSRGHVPFVTYTLTASFIGNIITLEYLHGYVPLFTWFCIGNSVWKFMNRRFKSNKQSGVTPLSSTNMFTSP